MNMYFKKWLSLICILCIMGCTLSATKKTDITFADYVKTLDNIPLPFVHNTQNWITPELSTYYDTAGFKKYFFNMGLKYTRPFGVLYEDSSKIVIMNLYHDQKSIVPIFVSYDKQGKEIDFLSLEADSALHQNSIITRYFKVDKKHHIILIDTFKNWENNRRFHSANPIVDSTIYHISKNGAFVIDKKKKF